MERYFFEWVVTGLHSKCGANITSVPVPSKILFLFFYGKYKLKEGMVVYGLNNILKFQMSQSLFKSPNCSSAPFLLV